MPEFKHNYETSLVFHFRWVFMYQTSFICIISRLLYISHVCWCNCTRTLLNYISRPVYVDYECILSNIALSISIFGDRVACSFRATSSARRPRSGGWASRTTSWRCSWTSATSGRRSWRSARAWRWRRRARSPARRSRGSAPHPRSCFPRPTRLHLTHLEQTRWRWRWAPALARARVRTRCSGYSAWTRVRRSARRPASAPRSTTARPTSPRLCTRAPARSPPPTVRFASTCTVSLSPLLLAATSTNTSYKRLSLSFIT